jgi:RNA polymerase sigma-70 factor (ECF subfamily)
VPPNDMLLSLSSHVSPTTDADQARFNQDLRSLLPGLSRYAASLARNPDLAQDLVQETSMRAWRSRGNFVAGTNFKAWLYRILRNCFLSYVRHQQVARTDTLGDDFPDVPVACDQESVVMLKEVQHFWNSLPPEQQRSMQLVGIEGRSYEEAAAIEHVPLGTIKSRVSRGRDLLRAIVEGEVIADAPITAETGEEATQPVTGVMPLPHHSDDDRLQIEMLRRWRERRSLPRLQAA